MVPPVEYAEQHYGENPVVETTETRESSLQQTRCDSGWRRGLKGLDLVAAAILCCVKGCVGSVDQSPRGVLGPSLGKPDADSLAARHEAEQTGRNGVGLFKVASGQGEGELLPAPSSDDVTGAQLGADGGDKVPQQYVAGDMAVGVVVGLEVVHVDQGDGERVAGAPGASQLAVNLLVPAATVCGPGEGVGACLGGEQGDKIGPVDRGADLRSEQLDHVQGRRGHARDRLVEADDEHGHPASASSDWL